MKALDEYILMVLFLLLLKKVRFLLNEAYVIIQLVHLRVRDHSNESSRLVHSNSAVCVSLFKGSSFSCKEYILNVLFALLLKRELIL